MLFDISQSIVFLGVAVLVCVVAGLILARRRTNARVARELLSAKRHQPVRRPISDPATLEARSGLRSGAPESRSSGARM